MKPKLVIWGASSHALVVADIVRLCGQYELVGFLDDVHPERHGSSFCDLPILGGTCQLDNLRRTGVEYIIFGFGNSEARLGLAKLVRESGYHLATAIHPRAIIAADVTVGAGTVIKAGAIVDPGVSIGGNVIVGAGASIAHYCTLEDGVRLSAGVHLAGGVRVKSAAWLGVGVAVKDNLHIGARSLIGIGAVVTRDIPRGVVAYGVPARVVRAVTDADG